MENIPFSLLQEFAKSIIEAMNREDRAMHDSQNTAEDHGSAA